MNYKNFTICLTVLVFNLNGCNVYYEGEINDSLLYVQEVKKGEGIYAGKFGQIMAFDLHSEEPFILLKDSYYNHKPGWVQNGERIYFEGKRGPDFNYIHLSSKSSIYTYDLLTGKLQETLFKENPLYKLLPEQDYEINIQNPIKRGDVYLSFTYRYVGPDPENPMIPFLNKGIKLLDMKENTEIKHIHLDQNDGVFESELSCNGDYIAAEKMNRWVTMIDLYDIKSGDVQRLQKGEGQKYTKFLGNWNQDKQAFNVTVYDREERISAIYAYHVLTGELTSIHEFEKDLLVYAPIEFGEYLYFLARRDSNYDLYKLNLNDRSVTQLTDDGLYKAQLSGPDICN